jgi:hypothetical protein
VLGCTRRELKDVGRRPSASASGRRRGTAAPALKVELVPCDATPPRPSLQQLKTHQRKLRACFATSGRPRRTRSPDGSLLLAACASQQRAARCSGARPGQKGPGGGRATPLAPERRRSRPLASSGQEPVPSGSRARERRESISGRPGRALLRASPLPPSMRGRPRPREAAGGPLDDLKAPPPRIRTALAVALRRS